jgi:hypothetical protein
MQSTATQTDGPLSKSKNVVYRLPAHADFLTAYSTAPSKDKHFDNELWTWFNPFLLGHTAYRKPFIKAFCEELSSQQIIEGKIDFLSMLTNVQRKVALELNDGGTKQIPSVTSTLTRKIFF